MARLIERPSIIQAAGNKPKEIAEYVGGVNTGDTEISVAHMTSPEGWREPGQTPHFREITVVLKGVLNVECRDQNYHVAAGQAIIVEPGEWVRYSTFEEGGAQYIAICLPAFSPDSVYRDPQ